MPDDAPPPARPVIVSPDAARGSARDRTPPGQTLTAKWPVLQAGPVPVVDPRGPNWRLRIFGRCDAPYDLTYDQLLARPAVDVVCDLHCVTHWSRLDNVFTGVATAALVAAAQPHAEAAYVVCHAERGFTVNLPLAAFTAADSLLAYAWNGRPLTAEHGYPLRSVVPRLYLYKSAKWLRGIELRATDAPGFWEQGGYHMHGDPWAEQRFGW